MSEPITNIGWTCPVHGPRPRPDLYGNLPLESFVGLYAKLGFDTGRQKPTKEHMWVLVTGFKDNELIGTVNNDPIFCDFECGQEFAFTRDEIEDLLKP